MFESLGFRIWDLFVRQNTRLVYLVTPLLLLTSMSILLRSLLDLPLPQQSS
jgi:hypothetical protein